MANVADSAPNKPAATSIVPKKGISCAHVKRLLTQLKNESRLLGSSPTFAHALRINYDRLNPNDLTVPPLHTMNGVVDDAHNAESKLLELRFKYTIIPDICLQQNNKLSITTCLAIIEEVTHWVMLLWRGNAKRNAIISTVLQAEWGPVARRPSPGDEIEIVTYIQRNNAKESSSVGFVNAEIRNEKGLLIFYASTVKANKKQYAIQNNKVLAWNNRYNNRGGWHKLGMRGNKQVPKTPQTYNFKQLFGYIEYLDRTEQNKLQLSATFPPMVAHGSLDGPIHPGCQAILMELVGKEEAKNVLSSQVELEFIYVTYQSLATACVQIDTEVLSHSEHRLSMRVTIRSVTSPSESRTSIISEGLLHWVPCDFSSHVWASFDSDDAYSNAVAPASVIHRAQRKPPAKQHVSKHDQHHHQYSNGQQKKDIQARRKSEDDPLDPLDINHNNRSLPNTIEEEDSIISLTPVEPPEQSVDLGEIKAEKLGEVAPVSHSGISGNVNGAYSKRYDEHNTRKVHKISARISPKKERHDQEEQLQRHQSRFSLEKAASRGAFHNNFYSNSEPHRAERSPSSLELAVAAVNESHNTKKGGLKHSFHTTAAVEQSPMRSRQAGQRRSESPVARQRGQQRTKPPMAGQVVQRRLESPVQRENNYAAQYHRRAVPERAPPSQRWEKNDDTNTSPEIMRRKSPPPGPIRFEKNIDSPTPSMVVMNQKLNEMQAGTPKELVAVVASRSKSTKTRAKTKMQYVPAG